MDFILGGVTDFVKSFHCVKGQCIFHIYSGTVGTLCRYEILPSPDKVLTQTVSVGALDVTKSVSMASPR